MDGFHFDILTRQITTRLSRRTSVGGLAALGLLALLGLRAPVASAAKHKGDKKKKKTCPPCKKRKNGKCKGNQLVGTPCAGGTCDGNGLCTTAPATCSDGSRMAARPTSTAAGRTVPRCGVGQGCLSRSDCASAICTGGICQTCTPGAVCAAGGVCSCVLPTNAATTTCVALPPPPAIAGSCPGSCPAGTVALGGPLASCSAPVPAPPSNRAGRWYHHAVRLHDRGRFGAGSAGALPAP